MKLSKRLNAVANMVTSGNTLADIGTDHGFLPIELVKESKVPKAIAMDIVSGPLDRAKAHIYEAGLNDLIECRLSDGFDKLDIDEVDTAVIAGMGGDLIANILEKKPRIAKELVLSPHTHPEIVRKALVESNYEIVDEAMLIDAGKYYVVIKAIRKDEKYDLSKEELLFGSILLSRKDNTLKSYLLNEVTKFSEIPQKREYVELVKRSLW